MRRLALLLAASVLGTGCLVVDDDDDGCGRSLNVVWQDFTDANDVLHTTCSAAGVNFVDVYVDGQAGYRFSCVNATNGTIPIGPGQHTITVEGVSAASFEDPGAIFYRDEFFQVDTTPCGQAFLDPAHPAEQYVQLQYSFAACSAVPSYIWYSITDEVTGLTISEVGTNSLLADKRFFTCQADEVFIPLPTGRYTLEWIEETVEPTQGNFAVTHANCTPRAFDVAGEYFANGTVGVPVVLAQSSVSCEP